MIRQKVEELVGSEAEWGHFFEECCKSSERLRAQAWQFRDELQERSRKTEWRMKFVLSDVEDALLELAVELLPDTPAGSCDPRELLFREAVAWLTEHQPDQERWANFAEGLDWYVPLGEFREELRRRMKAATREAAA